MVFFSELCSRNSPIFFFYTFNRQIFKRHFKTAKTVKKTARKITRKIDRKTRTRKESPYTMLKRSPRMEHWQTESANDRPVEECTSTKDS